MINFLRKAPYKSSAFLLVSVIVLGLLYVVDYDSHVGDQYYLLEEFNAQGLYCLESADRGNELFVIDGDHGSVVYRFDPVRGGYLERLFDFTYPDGRTQKSRYPLAHTTSIESGDGLLELMVVNSMSRLAPKLYVLDYQKLLNQRHLVDDNILLSKVWPGFGDLHIEKIEMNSRGYLLLSGIKNNKPTIQFVYADNLDPVCDLDIDHPVQNLYWDEQSESLMLVQNIIAAHGSVMREVKFHNDENLIKGVCPDYSVLATKVFITYQELEAFAKCGDNHYYLYNNIFTSSSSLYVREK